MHDLTTYIRTFLEGPFSDVNAAIRALAGKHGERSMLITELDGKIYGRPWAIENVDPVTWPESFAILSKDDVSSLFRPAEEIVEYAGDPGFYFSSDPDLFPWEDYMVDDDMEAFSSPTPFCPKVVGGRDMTQTYARGSTHGDAA